MAESKKKSRAKPRQTKDRVLQARIPRHLDEELREQAEQLGLSVSTVVRNVLLNTFQLVEGVVVDSTKLAKVIQGRKTRTQRQLEPEILEPSRIIGWQEAVLNLNGICNQCNKILHRGEKAAVGVPANARPALLCLSCLAALSTVNNENPRSSA